MKIMVVSSKGGVGKSTISMQLIAPYLYIHNEKKPVRFYECDDENSDSLSFGASNLIDRKLLKVDVPILREELHEIFSKPDFTCIDIGGNKSTTMVLDAMDLSGAIHFVDLAVIPILDGEQDAINASVVYSQIKSMNPDIKFLFVLNRCKNERFLEYQFENYFGDIRGIFNEKYAVKNYLFDEDKNNYVAFLDDEVVKYSRKFGLTVYEIAKQQRDFIPELKIKVENMTNEQETKLLSFKNYVNKSATKYYENVLLNGFRMIDKILKKGKL
jgi:hypothetical protein